MLFQNILAKLVSSHCKGKAQSKGRSIKLFPRPIRPKENMRDYSASQHYMAQMEFCSFGILFLKSGCQINTQNKSQSSCRSIYVINDNAEWVTVQVKISVMVSTSPQMFLVAPPLWRNTPVSQQDWALQGLAQIPAGPPGWEMSHELKSSSNQGLKSMLPKSPEVNSFPFPPHVLIFGICLLADLSGCSASMFGFWSFQSFSTRTLVLSVQYPAQWNADISREQITQQCALGTCFVRLFSLLSEEKTAV